MDLYGWVSFGIVGACALIWIVCQFVLFRSKRQAEKLFQAAQALEAEGKHSEAVTVYCEALQAAIEAPEAEEKIIDRLRPLYQNRLPATEFAQVQQLLHDLQTLTRSYQQLLEGRMLSDNVKRAEENQTLKLAVLAKLPRTLAAKEPPTEKAERMRDEEAPNRVRFHCPKCSKVLKAPPSQAGKTPRCPGCGEMIPIPKGIQ